MELLIPGLILVALMVYASTRIKRVAAEAFEAETIDTAEFSIDKPEGFLNVIRPHDGLALEAYSKDFGSADAADFKAARAEIRIYRNRSLKYASGAIREAAKVTSETTEVIDGRKYVVFEAEMVERGIGFREIYKLAESGGNVVELKFIVLETLPEAISAGVDVMLSSFTVK